MFLNISSLGVVAGLASVAFASYCIYFDNKRRSHPDFKKKLYERRRRNIKSAEQHDPPILTDQSSIERYFIQEIQRSEILIRDGNFELGADHLINAIAVCKRPAKFLNGLEASLPAEVFTLLANKLHNFNMNSAHKASMSVDNLITGLIPDDGSVE